MAPQVKDFEEFLAQAMTSSTTTTISASPSLASASLYSSSSTTTTNNNNNPSSPSSDHSPAPFHDQELDQLEQAHRNDDSFYDNLAFDTPPPQTAPSSRSHAIYLNPHSQELSPMQLVALSNLKLNNEMFSNRSLSIQKRIQVKNLLTLLYTLHPPHLQEYFQIQTEEQQQEEQQPDKTTKGQWTTLDAAGLQAGERSSSLQGVPPSASSTPSQPLSNNPFLKVNNTLSSSPSKSSSEPEGSDKAAKVPLPRPKSTDLPQSLHSYLSTVFDVDWSVGLSTTEDSLFTLHGAGSSSSGSGSSSSMSGPGAPLSSSPKRKSLSASSSLSLSLSLSDFMTPSGSDSGTHVNGNANGGVRSSTASTTSSSSSLSTSSSSSSTASSVSGVSVGNGASSTPLVRKSSLPSQPQNINAANRGPTNNITNTNSGISTSGGDTIVRKQSIVSKPMMVPGRRSSLLQTGQMPTAVNTSSSSGTFSPGIGRNNSYTTPKSPVLSGSSSPTLSPYNHVPSSPSLSPTLSPTSSGSFSFGNGAAPPSPSLSPTLSPTLGNKPAISRRTSSLPTERPRQNQRLPSSENGIPTLSSLASPASGLPRPLQTSTVSSLSSSPPSPSTLAPSGLKHLQAPYPYSRSVSDEHINFSSHQQHQYTRRGASPSSPTSPSYQALPPNSSNNFGPVAASSTSLAKPLPSYTLNKASKSSPNLGDGGSGPNYYGDNHPALPLALDHQYQQQFQQQFFQKSPSSSPSPTEGASGEQHKSSASGFNKLLSRASSRRGAVGNTAPAYAAGQHGATSISAAMTISAPLSLISSMDQESFQSPQPQPQPHHHHHNNNSQYQYQSQPQAYKAQALSSSPRSYGHGYSQSVSGHNVSSAGHGQPASTIASASSGGGGGGGGNRWSSMKTMLGLRVGQTKG